MSAPKMPEEYKGTSLTPGGYVTSVPRAWTKEEIQWCEDLKNKGFSAKEIAESIDRGVTATSIKLKRLSKTQYSYNEPHKADKYATNEKFLAAIEPDSVLDVYAGLESFYQGKVKNLRSNDKNPEAKTDDHADALAFLCGEFICGRKYDIVDLDPFGSAYDCLDLAVKIAKKGLAVTLGEMGHKRWNRLDYVRTHYGIETMDQFTAERIVQEIQKIGERNKKQLEVVALKNWPNISRVYFRIGNLKVTEQWKKREYLDGQLEFDMREEA